ncbi:MAG: hypothetical protein WB630_05660, partial [Candidatus Acidiferrales bacterium]
KDIADQVREVLQPISSLGVREFTFDAAMDTDNFDFLIEGVPTLVANQEPANYMLNYHATSDTFDKVDITQLKRQVAISALTVFALADSPERVGTRQSRAQIEQLMRDTGLDQEMKKMGFWPLWERSERGRQP